MTVEPTTGAKVRSGLAWGLANTLTLRLGSLAVGVLLAHLLSPKEFGTYAVALTAQSILVTFSELGLTAALVRGRDLEARAPTAMTLGLILGVGLAVSMSLLAEPIAVALGSAAATNIIRVLSLTLILSGISVAPSAVIQRSFMQSRQFIADSTSLFVSSISTILFIWAGMGPMSLAWSRVIGQAVTLALLMALSRTRLHFGFNAGIASELAKFGLPLCLANFLSWLLLSIDYIVVGHQLGATSLGIYVLAFNIASWPTSAISQSLRGVALPAFSRQNDDGVQGKASTGRALVLSTALTWACAAPMAGLLLVLSAPLILALYGSPWAAAAGVLAGLSAFGAMRTVFDLFATFLTAKGATRRVLIVQVIWTVSLAPAMILGVHIGGLQGAAWAHVAIGTLVVLPAYLVAIVRQGTPLTGLSLAIARPSVAAVLAGAVAFVVTSLIAAPWVSLLLAGASAGLLYAALTMRWIKSMINQLQNVGSPGST